MFKGSFTDGNGEKVSAGDEVEYRFGERRGELIDALQDGDAQVFFYDTSSHELVKWHHLCKVPDHLIRCMPPKEDDRPRNYDYYIV